MSTVLIVDYIATRRTKSRCPVVDSCWMEPWTPSRLQAGANVFPNIYHHIPVCEGLWARGGYRAWCFIDDETGHVLGFGDNEPEMRQMFGWLTDD